MKKDFGRRFGVERVSVGSKEAGSREKRVFASSIRVAEERRKGVEERRALGGFRDVWGDFKASRVGVEVRRVRMDCFQR